jgi:predicted acylesterase/phospholipase RssA
MRLPTVPQGSRMPFTRSEFLVGSTASAVAAASPTPPPVGKPPFYALVLSGGGVYGAYEAGVLSRLPALGVTYDVVCGTSIGALNGAMFASAQLERLVNLWKHIGSRTVVALPSALEPQTSTALLARPFTTPHRFLQAALGKVQGIYSAQPGLDILREMLVTPDGSRVVPFHTPFFWAVTDLTDLCGTYYYQAKEDAASVEAPLRAAFDRRGGRLRTIAPTRPQAFVDAVRASAAVPAFFEPASLDGRLCVDGGVVNNSPFDVAKIARRLFGEGRPLEIHVVFNAPRERALKPKETQNAFDILLACYDVMQKRLVDDDARLTLREAELAGRMAPPTDERMQDAADVHIAVIRPSSELEGSFLDFADQASVDENFARGARDADAGWKPYAISPEFCAIGGV